MTSRVAFITGAGSGIGAATAHLIAAQGRAVAVADINAEGAAQVAEAINAAGHQATAVHCDVTNRDSVEAAFAHTTETFGTPTSVLVNVAGWDRFIPFVDTDEEFWDEVIEINYKGVLRTCQVALGAMIEEGYGRIVNVASDAGRVGSSMESIYSGAKAGVIGFSKTLARETARAGITVNAVCPGPTDTPLLASAGASMADGGERFLGSLGRAVPMGRIATPNDIAPAIAFLASDQAGYITGQTLSASGGLTMAG